MKKILLTLGLSTILVTTACGQTQEETKNAETEEKTEATQQISKETIQSTLLDSQLALAKDIREHNAKIEALRVDISKLDKVETDEEKKQLEQTIKDSTEEAKKAASTAQEALNSFEIKGKLSEDTKNSLQASLDDLNAYFEEVKSTLDKPLQTDFSKADDLFTSFEDKLASIYENADLLAPNMKKELQ
ncbi:hypothetical protein GLW08_00025 [Pontibacillus yanchengensis]|uniref:Uncharacterized protein n=2 Tax=Pontibacillus yanchengensis TaxID=462910 RepID=A0ACC7VCA6_9BACI|nr:hypothetical protein [Pontibacillus yanchengensis]MYL32805.1 hypothetical protein [Pontibacillus yanchengensis]MYL51715.1 hypothetical protein [Pontibacillus yanchengensis]